MSSPKKIPILVITIQPFSDISASDVWFVYKSVKEIYPSVEIKKPINLPKSAFYSARNRYRADSLLHFLSKQTLAGHVTIGLTAKDISARVGNISDWGIMGLGLVPGNVCVASSFRLSKDEIQIQLFKVAIHELGHTQGLHHCEVQYCFMRDAEGQNTTNEEKDFCPKCKAVLISKGWHFPKTK